MSIQTHLSDDLDVPEFMRGDAAESRPVLSLVKPAPGPVEGAVVEHQGGLVVERRPRPEWMKSSTELKKYADYHKANTLDWLGHHASHAGHYVGWSLRGYGRLVRRWSEAHRDVYPQLIRTAREELREAKGRSSQEAAAKVTLAEYREEYRRHKLKHWMQTGVSTVAGGAAVGSGVVFGGFWVDMLLGLAGFAVGAYHGRPVQPEIAAPQAPRKVSQMGEEAMRRVLVEGGAVPEKRAEEIRGVGIPHTEGPGIAYTVDLPSGIPASVAVGKKEQIASALGVHKDWMDLDVDRGQGSNASRLKVWVSHEDPFDVVRPSPLAGHKGVLDTWHDGLPATFGKRGNAIVLRVRDTSLLVGGATRRGKGMLLANLLIGVARDPWVNVRVFDGKGTAEHNPFAPLLATFVKRNPERLAHFLRAVLEDMDRRSDILDELGLEKLEDDGYSEVVKKLGGRELVIIDELATYTPTGTSPFADEIVESLSQIAAVGASLGVILVSLTQVPEVSVIRGRLRQNHIGRIAMNTESGQASNNILGDGMTGAGYNAADIPLSQPGRNWMSTPETGVLDSRSFLVKPDDKRAAAAVGVELRREAGRLPGQWHDPIEARLTAWTGVSSAAGGERGNGRITRVTVLERLELLAKTRGSVTNGEVIQAFAAHDPAKYGRRDGESDRAHATRAGKLIKDEIDAAGAQLETRRVPSPDGGERSTGYSLDDIVQARQAAK